MPLAALALYRGPPPTGRKSTCRDGASAQFSRAPRAPARAATVADTGHNVAWRSFPKRKADMRVLAVAALPPGARFTIWSRAQGGKGPRGGTRHGLDHLIALVAAIVAVLVIPAARRSLISNRCSRFTAGSCPDVADRAGSHRRRNRVVGRRTVLRQARLGKAHRLPATQADPEELGFLDNETEQLCAWRAIGDVHIHYDLPPHVWQFVKDKGFLE